jgi:putative peptide zinc metalloprotease protein
MPDPNTPRPTLPRLHPLVKIFKGPDHKGEPSWILYHPISHQHFQISWLESEILARLSHVKTEQDLLDALKSEKNISLSPQDLNEFFLSLYKNGLLETRHSHTAFEEKKRDSFWYKLIHHYLFFTVPLFKPDFFLRQTFPYIKFFFEKPFIFLMLSIFGASLLYTLPRSEEFFATFTNLLSLEGLAIGFLALTCVKIIHEFAHAYTATKYNVRVPHMGVAFMVLTPVLYTETTASWQLQSQKQRFHIGLAGIVAELCLAGLFLILWNISENGTLLHSLSFTVVAISLVGSLLINLNPLMRFDGYYMLCDATGLDNLQYRATAFARWKLRHFLFGLKDPEPEQQTSDVRKFLIGFGFALIVYRFFLFLGIALLVYHLFFKPLGLILMIIELAWFIGKPILSELKIWSERRQDILAQKRGRFVGMVVAALILLSFVPLPQTLILPAIQHQNASSIFAPVSGKILHVSVEENQVVQKGDTLFILSAANLEQEQRKAEQELKNYQDLYARTQSNPELRNPQTIHLEDKIKIAQKKRDVLSQQTDRLTVTAPQAGRVRDLSILTRKDNYINNTTLLLRVVAEDKNFTIDAYADTSQLPQLKPQQKAEFLADTSLTSSTPITLQTIQETPSASLEWPELASQFKGSIATKSTEKSKDLVPLRSVYKIRFQADHPNKGQKPTLIVRGIVRVSGHHQSLMGRWISKIHSILIAELGLN